MIKTLKLWWYRYCSTGAAIEIMSARIKLQDAESRILFYEHRIRQLSDT